MSPVCSNSGKDHSNKNCCWRHRLWRKIPAKYKFTWVAKLLFSKMRVVTAQDKEGKHIRVWMNFKEVTHRTFYAQLPKYPFVPGIGLFKMHKLNEHGKRYLVTALGEQFVAEEEVRGLCWFVRKEIEKKGK